MIGRFNELTTNKKGHKWNGKDAIFRVGIGESADKRKDAFRVMKNGDVVVNGTLTVTGVVTATGGVEKAGKRRGRGRRRDDPREDRRVEAEARRPRRRASGQGGGVEGQGGGVALKKLLELDAKVAQRSRRGGAA